MMPTRSGKMITSRQNETIKKYLKLKQKKYRDLESQFLVYGDHLIEMALKRGNIELIITSNDKKEGLLVSKLIMDEFSQTETTFDSLAVCNKVNNQIKSDKILILDDIQNPDNAGALIRSASAFGFRHIIFSLKSADFYNEKTIRASQGAIFDVYHERVDLVSKIKLLKEQGYLIVGATAHGNSLITKTSDKVALVLGNEGAGISSKIEALLDLENTIKTENVESLNVSIAGSILMYEWSK
jgi:TrmH family RNA methyltransferase